MKTQQIVRMATAALVTVMLFCAGARAQDDAAQFVSQSVPATMTVGESVAVTVIMKNTGTFTWTPGGDWRLGSHNPQDNVTWGFNRVQTAATVAPGEDSTYAFNVTAPATPGTYNFQCRMVHDGVTWFGDLSQNVAVSVVGRAWNTNDNGNWSEGAKWTGGMPNGVGAAASLDVSGGISDDRTVTLDLDVTLGSLTLNDTSAPYNSWTIAQGGAYGLTFDASAGNAAVTVSRGANNAFNVPIALNDNVDIGLHNNSKLILGGNVSGDRQLRLARTENGGAGGTLRLEGTNGFNALRFEKGTLEFTSAAALGSGAITLGYDTWDESVPQVLNNVSGGAVIITNNLISFTGPSGGYAMNERFCQGGDMTFAGTFTAHGYSPHPLLGRFHVDGSTHVVVSNGISSGVLWKLGTGRLDLMADAASGAGVGGFGNYNGGNPSGVLGLGSPHAMGSLASFEFGANANATLKPLNTDCFLAADFIANSGRVNLDGTAGYGMTLTGKGTMDYQTFSATGPGVLTLAGQLANTSLTFIDSPTADGKVVFSGNNTNLPSLNLNHGTFGIGHDNAAGVGTISVFYWSWTVPVTITAENGARTVTNNISLHTDSASVLNISGTNDLALNGNITGGGGVNKHDACTLRLNSAGNTYSAGSGIYGGILAAGHADALGTSGAITAYSNGTFAVANGITFTRPVTFNAGSGLGGIGTFVRGAAWALPASFTVRPGLGTNAVGTLTVDTSGGELTFGDNTLEIDFAGGSADKVTIAGGGALNLGGTSDKLVLRGAPAPGSYVIAEAASVSGVFGNVDTTGLEKPASVSYTATQVIVNVAPKGTVIFIR